MRITAGDVIPLDRSKRTKYTGPSRNQLMREKYKAKPGEPWGRTEPWWKSPKRIEEPGMEAAFQSDDFEERMKSLRNERQNLMKELPNRNPNLDLPLQGEDQDDIEALLYFYDQLSGSLSEARDAMVEALQKADPAQKQELARLIRNIGRAMQVLGQ